MKFGVQIENHLGFSYDAVQKIALEAERLGYDGLFICDHWIGRTDELARQPCLDTWLTLGALAKTTRRIRLGALVSAVGFRYPATLAKMAATLDHISGGRLQFAIGAGWYEPEYRAYGIPFPSTRQRMEQLREAIQIIKMMWTQDKPSFEGKHYKIRDASCYPRPVQTPRPTIWVGGTGEQTLLRIVAEFADGWNVLGQTPQEYEHKLKILQSYCASAGRNIDAIEKSYYSPAIAERNEADFQTLFKQYYGSMKKPDETIEAFTQRVKGNRPFVGTVNEVIEKMTMFRKLGVTYTIFYFPDKDKLQQMRLFAEHIIPTFKNI